MVLPLFIHRVVEWKPPIFFNPSDKETHNVLKFWKANTKYVKKTVYLHKKKCSLANKNSPSVFFPMSITKQLLQEDWAQVLLTNINSLSKFFLYDEKKQKNSGKSLKL